MSAVNAAVAGRQVVQNGAARVRPMRGPYSQAHNRELLDVGGTIKTASWIVAENTTEVTITVSPAAGTFATGDGIFITFDAPNDLIAASWLTEAEHADSDSQRYKVCVASPRVFTFSSNILRADMKIDPDSGITAAHVILEAH